MQVESVTPERIDSTTYPSASIEEIPDKEMIVPEETAPVFNTKDDIWENYEPMVTNIATYQLQDEDVVRNNASHHVIWRFSLGNTWHKLAAPLWVLSAAIPI